MTPLPSEFIRDGFRCRMLKRSGRVVMLQLDNRDHYEVATVQLVKEKTWKDGHTTPAHEAMPSASQWGVLGWSFLRLADAEAKYSALLGGVPKKCAKLAA